MNTTATVDTNYCMRAKKYCSACNSFGQCTLTASCTTIATWTTDRTDIIGGRVDCSTKILAAKDREAGDGE